MLVILIIKTEKIFSFTTLNMKRLYKNCVKSLYFIINKMNGNLKMIVEDDLKHYFLLMKIKMYEEIWNKIQYLIKLKSNNSDDYDEILMKIRFNRNYDSYKRIIKNN